MSAAPHFDRRRSVAGPAVAAPEPQALPATIAGGCWCGGDLVLESHLGPAPVAKNLGYTKHDAALAQRALDGFMGGRTDLSLTVTELPVSADRYRCRNAPVGSRPEGCGRAFARILDCRRRMIRIFGEAAVRLW